MPVLVAGEIQNVFVHSAALVAVAPAQVYENGIVNYIHNPWGVNVAEAVPLAATLLNRIPTQVFSLPELNYKSAIAIAARAKDSKHGNILPEASTGVPPKGDFERMSRRRFQDPKPKRRGNWWILQYWREDFSTGVPKRKKAWAKLALASMPLREVKKIAAELLRPINQGLESIGSATNFNHYVENTYNSVVMPLFAKSTQERYQGVIANHLLPAFGDL